MDQECARNSNIQDVSSSWTTSVPSNGPWDKHFKKPKVANGWGQWVESDGKCRQDNSWGQGNQVVDKTPGQQHVEKGWFQAGKGEEQDKKWAQWRRDMGWGQGRQVEWTVADKVSGNSQFLEKERPQVDKGWELDKRWGQCRQPPKVPSASSQYAQGDPVTFNAGATLLEMKNKSPKDPKTFSNNLPSPNTIIATKTRSMVNAKVLSIKLLIDGKANRVLFAEVEKEVIDFLFRLLSLPVASIIELTTKKNMAGSMGNLYGSLENISSAYIQPNLDKNSLLKPKVVLSVGNIPLLPSNVGPTGAKYYRCTTLHHRYITNLPGMRCPSCSHEMNNEMDCLAGEITDVAAMDLGGVKGGLVKYLLTDEMQVMPVSSISCITLLKKCNVADISSLEEKIVEFGKEGSLEVVKAAMHSKAVLTETFLGKKENPETRMICNDDSEPLLTSMEPADSSMVSEKAFNIKLLIDNENKRVLLAEAEKELIDFLFSLLALPVASIMELIKKQNMVGSMGNLYESVEKLHSTYLHPNLDKNSLLKPKVGLSAENFLLLPSIIGPTSAKYFMCSTSYNHTFVTNVRGTKCPKCPNGNYQMSTEMSYVADGASDVSARGTGDEASDVSARDTGYVEGEFVTYIVTDELVIMPMTPISCISLLKKSNVVDTSFLEEKTVSFGAKEGLGVLKAALQSKAVLTEVFIGKKRKLETD